MEQHLAKVLLISKGEEQLLGSASQSLFPFGYESSFCAQDVHQQEKKKNAFVNVLSLSF